MFDHVHQTLKDIHYLGNPVRLYPVEMAAPFNLIPNQVKISENPQDLRYV